MGLDQYLFKTKQTEEQLLKRKDEEDPTEEEIGFWFWRKHPNLQGYMGKLWREKYTEKHGDFNCEKVVLTLSDLEDWEQAVKNGNYPKTDGPFFGCDSDEEYKEYDLKCIEEAKLAISEGYTVYYDSWW